MSRTVKKGVGIRDIGKILYCIGWLAKVVYEMRVPRRPREYGSQQPTLRPRCDLHRAYSHIWGLHQEVGGGWSEVEGFDPSDRPIQ